MVLLGLCWHFSLMAAPQMGRKGLRGDPESEHPLAVLEEPSPARCCQGRWCMPPFWALPGRFSSPGVFCQTPHWQESAETYINLFSDIYRLQVALVTWLNPSLGLFDFICVVIFIRWPESLFPACLFCCLCRTVVRQRRQTRTLSSWSFTGAVQLPHLFYFPQQHSQITKS